MNVKITPAQLDEIEKAALAAMDSTRSLGKWTAVHDCVDDLQPGKVAQAQGSPRVAQHIAMMDPATTLALIAEVREMHAKVTLLAEAWQEGWDAAHEAPWTDGPTNPYQEEA